MKKLMIVLFAVLLAFGFLYQKKSITVKGSDTMVILAQRWAEKYMAEHSDVTIQVTGGGSGTGISALINGTTDICNASRPMKKSEREKLKQRFNSLGVEFKINHSNNVKDGALVSLRIYDILGNEVAVIINERKPAGNYKVQFDADGLPSGVYFYKLATGNFTETKKMVLLR